MRRFDDRWHEMCDHSGKAQTNTVWAVNRLMTKTVDKKSAQMSRGKKEADQTDEYNFFVTGKDKDSEEALINEDKESIKNGIINSKHNIDFFLPE